VFAAGTRPQTLFGVFRARERALVAANLVFPAWGANSAPQIPYLDLRVILRQEKTWEKGREGGSEGK